MTSISISHKLYSSYRVFWNIYTEQNQSQDIEGILELEYSMKDGQVLLLEICCKLATCVSLFHKKHKVNSEINDILFAISDVDLQAGV